MKSTQRGLTLVGFIMVLVLVVFAAYLAMRIVPMYTEFASVKQAFNTLAEEPGLASQTPAQIRTRLTRILDISYVDAIRGEDVEHTRDRAGTRISVQYERRAPIVFNLYIVADFEYEVELKP